MKADRLLSILLLLQSKSQLTAEELASRLEVSIRTIYRDIDSLSSIGIPIITDRGPNGGIRLLDEYKLSLNGLTYKDLLYLLIPSPKKVLNDLGIEKPNQSTFLKLLKYLPEEDRAGLDNMTNFLLIDAEPWNAYELTTLEKVILEKVQFCIWYCISLEILYRKGYEQKNSVINPLALVLKKTTWYVIAVDCEHIKTYKLSSILSATKTETKFIRPGAFNLEHYWKQSTRDFYATIPKYHVHLKTDKDTFETLKSRFLKILDCSITNETYYITLEFNAPFQAQEIVMGYGNKLKIISPPELIKTIQITAQQILSLYEPPNVQ